MGKGLGQTIGNFRSAIHEPDTIGENQGRIVLKRRDTKRKKQ